jgi:hypothetical protein
MKTCCFCYPSKTKVISYAYHQKKNEGILALLLDPHLLLQGDFFLTSRCTPPEWNKRVRKLRMMQLDEEA